MAQPSTPPRKSVDRHEPQDPGSRDDVFGRVTPAGGARRRLVYPVESPTTRAPEGQDPDGRPLPILQKGNHYDLFNVEQTPPAPSTKLQLKQFEGSNRRLSEFIWWTVPRNRLATAYASGALTGTRGPTPSNYDLPPEDRVESFIPAPRLVTQFQFDVYKEIQKIPIDPKNPFHYGFFAGFYSLYTMRNLSREIFSEQDSEDYVFNCLIRPAVAIANACSAGCIPDPEDEPIVGVYASSAISTQDGNIPDGIIAGPKHYFHTKPRGKVIISENLYPLKCAFQILCQLAQFPDVRAGVITSLNATMFYYLYIDKNGKRWLLISPVYDISRDPVLFYFVVWIRLAMYGVEGRMEPDISGSQAL
ncbi:hypothetical protein FA95DRAFT_1619286 [Auriscalpium vulgare]|uniref:Uncharacterized protein n=1 Tax=Auriscalpium vulgare TaxID=40419 RepID=A0ACB8RP84_9AGAM|nr:hypothetical protein FA95DRAFT_1619286 [Auriscalpium vulgare]